MSKKEESNNLSFEESMGKLDQIASELENGKLTLEQSIEKFEEGMNLSKKCNDLLDNAEKKITMLTKDANKVKEEDFKIEEQ